MPCPHGSVFCYFQSQYLRKDIWLRKKFYIFHISLPYFLFHIVASANFRPTDFDTCVKRNKHVPYMLTSSNGIFYQPHDCVLNCSFRRRSKETSKLRVTGLCAGNSPVTGEFPAQMASDAENIFIWWRHHDNTNLYRVYNILVDMIIPFYNT